MNRSLKKSFLIFWATAVLFICAGSLINFHQHKIWGKPLLPQLLYTKRDKENTLLILKVLKPDIPVGTGTVNLIDFNVILDQPYNFSPSTFVFTSCENPFLFKDQGFLFSQSLRAPPLT